MARMRLHLDRFHPPAWKRPGVWQGALVALAALPLLGALALRVQPGARAPEIVQIPPSGDLALRPIDRAPASSELDLIVSRNLFSPSRAEWVIVRPQEAVAETSARDADARRQARLKEAQEALDKVVFLATMRVGDHWSAYFDVPGRTAADDLLSLSVGDVYQGWTVLGVSRDGAKFGYEDVERSISLVPRVRAQTGRPAQPVNPGRSRVEVREPTASAGGIVPEPPLSRREAQRRVTEAVGDDKRLQELASELFESLDDEKR